MRYGVDVGRSGVKAVCGGQRLFMPALVHRWSGDPANSMFKERRVEAKLNGLTRIQSLPFVYAGEGWILGDERVRLGHSAVAPMEVAKASPMTRLLLFGVVAAVSTDPVVELCMGLPVSFFSDERDAMAQLLAGQHRIGIEDDEWTVQVRAIVVPEGFGLLMKACQDAAGVVDMDQVRRSTLVIDFGHRTTQVVLFRRGRLASQSFSLHRSMGEIFERALCELIDTPLRNPFDPIAHAVMGQDLVAHGTLTVNGLTVSYADAVPVLKKYGRVLWPELQAEMRRALTGGMYDRVVAGGGGVHLFEDELRELYGDKVEIVPDRYSQVEGYLSCLDVRKQLMEL